MRIGSGVERTGCHSFGISGRITKMLQYLGVLPEVMLDGTKDVMTAVHEDETTRYVALYAYNRVEYAPDEPNPDEFGVSSIFRKGTMKNTYQRPGKQSRKTIRIKLHDEEDGEIRLCNPWERKDGSDQRQCDDGGKRGHCGR